MAARMRKTHQDDIRAKIQTAMLVKRAEDHVCGEIELTATQVSCIKMLLNKTLPDLQSIELGNANGEPLLVKLLTGDDRL